MFALSEAHSTCPAGLAMWEGGEVARAEGAVQDLSETIHELTL